METKANHVLIGAFVLAMLAGAFGFIYWMVGAGGELSGRRYQIVFQGSVRGLTEASSVLFNGVKVGKVLTLEIYPPDPRKVLVQIRIEQPVPITVDTRARLETQGLTGLTAIQLRAGQPDAAELVAAEGQRYPIIEEDLSAVGNLFEAAPETLANINSVALRLDALIADNEKSVRNTLKNIEAFSGVLERNGGNIDVIVKDITELTGQLRALATKLETGVDKVNKFLTDDGDSVVSEAREAAASLKRLAERLEGSLGEGAGGLVTQAKRGLAEFEAFLKDGRNVARNLDRVIEKVDRDPQAFLFGGSKVREYQPGQ